ncbi:phosphoribosylamine--glycine ligase [Pelagibacteraceae bacterium]|nr:phosphoribosylamine--glycine ligase [Pelagibacteraceae bacterium]
MNIALIGSGGREHALCQKICQSPMINKVFCFPGNAGTESIAININIDFTKFNLLLKKLKKHKIDLVVVGPEQPLVSGMVDFLKKKGIKVFGPDKYASKLEGSKAFMKKVCKENNIPTASFKVCTKKNDVIKFLDQNKLPIVVKADGLAAGKGVTICKSKKAVIKISNEIFLGKFKSSSKLILEEFLTGEEVSYFIVADKKKFLFMGTAQDHKKVGEKETGPNTGGMGAYSPALIVNKKIEKKIINKIIKPTLNALKKKNHPFVGFLYAGLMIKNEEPYLIEYNIRMGDPECQVIMPRLNTDIVKIFNATIKNKLNTLKIKWKKEKCMTVVLCSKGYPGEYKKDLILKNLNEIILDKKSIIYHAGTKKKNSLILSNGGRVLNVTSVGKNFKNIRKKIFEILKKINWKNGFFRKDIGWKVIK